jgi:hypothetical protein
MKLTHFITAGPIDLKLAHTNTHTPYFSLILCLHQLGMMQTDAHPGDGGPATLCLSSLFYRQLPGKQGTKCLIRQPAARRWEFIRRSSAWLAGIKGII